MNSEVKIRHMWGECKRVMFLKKMAVLYLVIHFFILQVFCTDIIAEDFYLNDAITTTKEQIRVLPNTLREELFEGETAELFAETSPVDSRLDGIVWELKRNNGTISIYPNGEKCTVLAHKEGEESIEISVADGASANVEVKVLKKPEPRERSFERESEKKETGGIVFSNVLNLIVRSLFAIAFALLAAVLILFIKNRKGKRGK